MDNLHSKLQCLPLRSRQSQIFERRGSTAAQWHMQRQGFVVLGSCQPADLQITRRPSIRLWTDIVQPSGLKPRLKPSLSWPIMHTVQSLIPLRHLRLDLTPVPLSPASLARSRPCRLTLNPQPWLHEAYTRHCATTWLMPAPRYSSWHRLPSCPGWRIAGPPLRGVDRQTSLGRVARGISRFSLLLHDLNVSDRSMLDDCRLQSSLRLQVDVSILIRQMMGLGQDDVN